MLVLEVALHMFEITKEICMDVVVEELIEGALKSPMLHSGEMVVSREHDVFWIPVDVNIFGCGVEWDKFEGEVSSEYARGRQLSDLRLYRYYG